jgi:hypothetical protein
MNQAETRAGLWPALAFWTACVLAAASLSFLGSEERGTRLALQLTARLAFVPFWAAYAGGSLATLFGPIFQPLRRNARTLGLAFAASMPVHFALVAWLCRLGHAPSARTFVVFGIAALWTCALVLLSVPALRAAIAPRALWLMHTVGMNYLAYAFAVDFLRNPLAGGVGRVALYVPFAGFAVLGPALRLAAAFRTVGCSLLPYRSRRA